MKLRAAIISCVCLFLICSVSEATTKNWKVSKTIDISKKERVVFREVVPEEGAEWASTKGEILIEEVVSQNGQYKIKNYIVQNIPVVTRHYNAFISPDRTMLIFVKDKKLHSYDFASGKYQLLKEAHYVKQIPDFVKGYLYFSPNGRKTIRINDRVIYSIYLNKFNNKERKIGTIKVIISQEDGGGLNPLNWADITYKNGSLTISGRFIETATFNLQ